MFRTLLTLAVPTLGLLLAGSALAAESGSYPPALPGMSDITFDHHPGPDLEAAIGPRLFITAAALHRRDTNTTVSYNRGGCVTSSGTLTTDLALPAGATILGMRTFYFNDGSGGDVMSAITRYTGQNAVTDLLSTSFPAGTGYTSVYNELPIPETVNEYDYAYVLNARGSGSTQICAMLVLYQMH